MKSVAGESVRGEPAGSETLSGEMGRNMTVSGTKVRDGRSPGGEGSGLEVTAGEATLALTEGAHHVVVQLGEGGTAQVFLAVQAGAEGVDKLVVLKVLKPSFDDNDDVRHMFVSEARFAARLNHANIVQTMSIVQRAGMPAIVMEYLDGQALSSLLAKTRAKIPLELHLRIIIEALRGLHYAHELTDLAGHPLAVVHRDVSPQNVFVTYDGQVKLIDFGIAKIAGEGVDTVTGVIKGKVRYMAPEQIRGQVLDRRVDLYAAGILLWEAATREKMWKGASDVNIMHLVLNGKIPKPSDKAPDVPAELERIVEKALAFDREERYATAAELETDLEAFLGGYTAVTSRHISNFVSGEFAEIREQRRRVINAELSRRAAASHAAAEGIPPAVPTLHDYGHATGTASRSRPSASQAAPAPSVPPAPRLTATRILGAVVAALAVAVCGAAWRGGIFGGAPAVSAPSVSVASAPPSTPAREEPILPSSAPLATSSAAPEPSASASAAPSVLARAPEFAPLPRRLPRAAPPLPPPARASAPKRDCDPPYTLDVDGTKRFKPECL